MPPVTVERFRGLDLSSSDVGLEAASDLLNVDFDLDGRVRTRDGYAAFSATAGEGTTGSLNVAPHDATILLSLTYTESGGTYTIYLASYSTGGVRTTVGNWTGTGTPLSLTRIGTPSTTRTFIADPGGSTTMRAYGAGSVALSIGAPMFVATTPWDNRLVQAGFVAAADSPASANGSPSTVWFSDAGDPFTYTAADNAYTHLRPGDGESIKGAVSYADEVYVFKATSAWVFYGTSTDASGKPIFNKRRIDLPSPISSVNRVCAGERGVYYVTRDGLWRTTGGPPVLMSGDVADIFNGSGIAALELSSESTQALTAAGGRVFIPYNASGGARILVYDERLETWTVWSNIATSLAGFTDWPDRGLPRNSLYFLNADRHIHLTANGTTTDAGSAIASHYTSGWASGFGTPQGDGRHYIYGVKAKGLGSPTISVLGDYATSDTQAATVTLGSGTTPAWGRANRSYVHQDFAFKVSASSGAWTVDTVTLNEYP